MISSTRLKKQSIDNYNNQLNKHIEDQTSA